MKTLKYYCFPILFFSYYPFPIFGLPFLLFAFIPQIALATGVLTVLLSTGVWANPDLFAKTADNLLPGERCLESFLESFLESILESFLENFLESFLGSFLESFLRASWRAA